MILGPILSLKTTPREVLGVPSLKKQPLEALNHCPGGARCSPRAPRGAKKQPQRLSVKAFGLPGEALGRVWDVSGTPQWAIWEQNLIPNLISLLQAALKPFFWSLSAKFHDFLFLPTLRIYRNLHRNLHAFRIGPFQKQMQTVHRKIMKQRIKIH